MSNSYDRPCYYRAARPYRPNETFETAYRNLWAPHVTDRFCYYCQLSALSNRNTSESVLRRLPPYTINMAYGAVVTSLATV